MVAFPVSTSKIPSQHHLKWTGFALGIAVLLLASPASALTLRPGDIIVPSLDVIDEGVERGIVVVDPISGAQSLASVGSLFAGTGLLDTPKGIRVSSSGEIFLVDTGNNTGVRSVIRVDPETGVQEYVTTGGLLQTPLDLEIEEDGTLLVLDSQSGFLRVDPLSGSQTLLFDDFLFGCAQGLALSGTTAYVTYNGSAGGGCLWGGQILEVDLLAETVETIASTPVVSSYGAYGVALDEDGNLYASESNDPYGIWKIDRIGDDDELIAETSAFGLVAEADGSLLATELANNQILRIDPETGLISVLSEGGLLEPGFGIAVMPALVPEPSTALLFALGLVAMGALRRNSSRKPPVAGTCPFH